MTHTESQDLLLDLAYGELDAARAAEVSAHVDGCEECRREKAALDEVRKAAAPLRELEEPPPGFDHRILQAAAAQVRLEHENVGQVIEVTGSVKPLGVDATRIDAHAPVRAPPPRRRPRWMLRVAVAGSVATAAALALVVSTTRPRPAAPLVEEDYRIKVQPAAPQAVDLALREAEANKEAQRMVRQKDLTSPAPPPEPPVAALPPAPKQQAVKLRAHVEGGGGDAADSYIVKKKAAPLPAEEKSVDPSHRALENREATPQDAVRRLAGGQRYTPFAAASDQLAPMRQAAASSAAPANDAAAPARLEESAQRARHAGNYPLAAGFYREAAALRRGEDKDPASAAWDLAHAVECLAAAGLFDEARQVREELSRLYPGQDTAQAAARRALREVDVVPAPSAKPADH